MMGHCMDRSSHTQLRAHRMGIDTYQEPIIYMRKDCPVCRSEGFEAQSRVQVNYNGHSIIATLNVTTEQLLGGGEAGLSEAAWNLLQLRHEGEITVAHPAPVESLSFVRGKMFGRRLSAGAMHMIIQDITKGRYSDVQIASFLATCATGGLDEDEVTSLTHAMIAAGEKLEWHNGPILDKHCVGGLPGNRTTLIIVPIVAAAGLTIPKTSSRAITSPAGSADTMETLAPVNLDLPTLRRVVEKEHGCIAWGGAVKLSPADDVLIRVERPLDLDSEGQLIASVLSKKICAGSTHVLIDIPVGPTAKVRDQRTAVSLSENLRRVGKRLGIAVETLVTDGAQPVGRGIGPALEARDVLAVLQNKADAPSSLRERSVLLAAKILELSGSFSAESAANKAGEILRSGRAWKKFQAICEAQGGMREPPSAPHQRDVLSPCAGKVTAIDNRKLARVAKLAGAPQDKAAGVMLHTPLGAKVERDQPLFTVHAEAPGEMEYALSFVNAHPEIIQLEGM